MTLVTIATSCTEEPPPPQAPAPVAERPVAEVTGPIRIELVPQRSAPAFPLEMELLGLATVLAELALAEIPEVIPDARGAVPVPSLADAVELPADRWMALLHLSRTGRQIHLELRLCDPAGRCTEQIEPIPGGDPAPAVARAVAFIRRTLGREGPDPAQLARWSTPTSTDRYAAIVCGRGAASLLGLTPPPPSAVWGDRRKDPLARAVSIDPGLSVCHWLLARRDLGAGRTAEARAELERAVRGSEPRLLFWMDRAVAHASREAQREMLASWEGAGALGRDVRFSLGRARARLEAGPPYEALEELSRLPAAWKEEVPVLALRVRIADRGGPTGELDALLERWHQKSPADPEPVRRRIALRLEELRYADALELVLKLLRAHDTAQVRAQAIALAVLADRFDLAQQWARQWGDPELASLIAARRHLEENPTRIPEELAAARGAAAALTRAELHLVGGRPEQALREVDRIRAGPWLPHALWIKAKALAAARRSAEETRVRSLLRELDPALAADLQGPSTAPGRIAEGVQAQTSPP
jgi:hypothetical protein